jgi:hypothetical protein
VRFLAHGSAQALGREPARRQLHTGAGDIAERSQRDLVPTLAQLQQDRREREQMAAVAIPEMRDSPGVAKCSGARRSRECAERCWCRRWSCM